MRSLVKPIVKRALAQLGYDIRRTRYDFGENPFKDTFRLVRLLKYSQPAVVFDVGANVGTTVEEFHTVFRNPLIHAFEPGPEAFQQLTAKASKLSGVTVNNMGLGSCNGHLPFHQNELSVMSSFLESDTDCWSKRTSDVNVPVGTVDDYCEKNRIRRIDVLKSDTQGYDLEVLRGAERMLSNGRIYLILCEIIFSDMYKGLPDLDEIYRYLRDRGFSLVTFYRFEYQNNRAGWTDALFICERYARDADDNTLTPHKD
jgi:FkbM family methyltransferase